MGPRKALVREVNPHLICVLCHGYFIEATTITECLHSFCRSCLIKYLETSKFCPICDVQLHKNNPLLSVRCDQTLQQLVYKLVPGLYTNEMARRRKYYSELGGPSSDPDCSEYPVGDAYFAPEDSISLSLEFSTLSSCFKDEDMCASDGDDSLNMDKQNVLHRRYLQCPAAVTMSHLQKFLRMKYGFSHDVKVDIIYEGEVLSDHFSLMDVAYTFDWKRTAPMRFKFRLFQKAGTHAKGSSMERINRPLETKDKDDMILKPVAEAKVFAFASVPKQAPSISNKSTQSQPVNPKAVRESHVVMQCLDSKEVIMPSLSMKEKNFLRESKSVTAPKDKNVFKDIKSAAECMKGLEVKNGDAAKSKNNVIENNVEKVNKTSALKRTHSSSGDSEEEPPVEMKKLKIVLEPLTFSQDQGTIKMPANRPVPIKTEAPKFESPKAANNSQLTQPKKENGQNTNHQNDSSESTRKAKIGKEKPKENTTMPAPARQPMDEADDEEEEPNYMDDIIQEDEEEDRLRKTPSESDMVIEEKEDEVMDVQVESDPPINPMPDLKSRYSKSEEKRKEKKKNKKAKHHHHRHHDRKRDSPPIATILHSPDSDLKLKFKLTNTNSKPKYTILDNSEAKKEFNYSFSKQQDKCNEKEPTKELKIRLREDEKVAAPKKAPSPVLNNNYNSLNNNNNNNTHQIKNIQPEPIKSMAMETGSKERSMPLKISRTKVFHHTSAPKAPSPVVNAPKVPSPKVSSPSASAPQLTKPVNQQPPANSKVMNYLQKSSPTLKQQIPVNKQNGASSVKQEPIKMPPSSITVSKITAAEKAQMEQQKILMQRNNSMGLDSKRPSLEIMLVNAPKKGSETNADSKPIEVKKVIRPTPPSIPLSRLKNFGPKGSPPPLVLATNKPGSAATPGEDNGALDLSGKSSRKSPEIDSMRNLLMLSNTAAQERMLMTSLEPLKIPIPPAMSMKSGFQQNQQQPRSIKPGPNQNVRQIPNPSALMFRQHINNQRSVPPSLPINSLRKMESMAKNINIEKVAAGLTVKAAVQAGYQAK